MSDVNASDACGEVCACPYVLGMTLSGPDAENLDFLLAEEYGMDAQRIGRNTCRVEVQRIIREALAARAWARADQIAGVPVV